MKSIQISEPGQMILINQDLPIPDSGEVLIKIKYAGFCGSDLSSFLGKNPMVKYPVIPGHEVAGQIQKTGVDVPAHLEAGQLVTLIPYSSCGDCASCKRGRPNACQFNETLGVQRNGAMSEFITIHWNKLLPSNTLSMEELALAEPLTVGFHSVSRGRVDERDTVAVLGCGIIGIGAIISSVSKGARIIAVDIDDYKLDMARKLGARYTINSLKENVKERLNKITQGTGPDVMIEAAGQPSTYLTAINNVAFTGRVVCIGYAKEDIAFATKLFVQKELDILGSRNASTADFDEVIKFLEMKTLKPADLISNIVSPEKALDAMNTWVADPGAVFKILVDFES